MTQQYDPYENAIAERINGIIKQEFIENHPKLYIDEMKQLVKESITIYNQLRPHYSCNFKTPDQMHKQSKIKIKTYRRQIKNSSQKLLTTTLKNNNFVSEKL